MALERQILPRTYLSHHELEIVIVVLVKSVFSQACVVCYLLLCPDVTWALYLLSVHTHALTNNSTCLRACEVACSVMCRAVSNL